MRPRFSAGRTRRNGFSHQSALWAALVFTAFVSSSFGVQAQQEQQGQPAPRNFPWTTEEIGRMPPVTLIKAGTILVLMVAPNDDGVQPGGTWEAEMGTLRGNRYTAPRFMPATGLDTIAYTAPNGHRESVEVRIVPNPHLPGPSHIPYLECPAEVLNGNSKPSEKQTPMSPETKRFYVALATAPPHTFIVATGTKPAPPVQVMEKKRIKRESIGSQSFFRLPASGYRINRCPLAVRRTAQQEALFFARIVPLVTPEITANRYRWAAK